MGFEPTIPMFQGAKMAHALDRADIVIGKQVQTCTFKHKEEKRGRERKLNINSKMLFIQNIHARH
jgi:hypothetical protein